MTTSCSERQARAALTFIAGVNPFTSCLLRYYYCFTSSLLQLPVSIDLYLTKYTYVLTVLYVLYDYLRRLFVPVIILQRTEQNQIADRCLNQVEFTNSVDYFSFGEPTSL